MKFKDFRRSMEKDVFKTAEAHVVAFEYDSKLINLQLHQWKKSGDLIQLKRGVYMFAGTKPDAAEIAEQLYSPCYFSLEYVLSLHSIIPEAVFSYTLVTTKATRNFTTPLGNFIFHKIKKNAFTGFDKGTLIADKEKALVDYFYLNSSRIEANDDYWEESRLNGAEVNFKKALRYAREFHSKKLNLLLKSFQAYAKSH